MTKIRFGEKMTILGNNPFVTEEPDTEEKESKYTHALYKKEENEIPLKTCVFISAMLHPVTIGLIWLMIFILALLGVNFAVFNKPEPKPKDIEFVLVQKEADPINKNTKYRADRNSRAGGIHDPKRAVSLPSQSPSGAPKASAPSQPAQQPKQPKQQAKQPAQQKPQQPKKPAQKAPTPAKKPLQMPWEAPPAPKQVQKPAPQKPQGTTQAPVQTPAPRPALKPTAPKTTQKPQGSFNMPVPKTTAPKVVSPTGGPVTGAPSGGRTGSGTASGGGRFSPSPSFSPAGSGGASSAKRAGTGRGGAGGSVGNPGPGNPKGAPGIDALKEPDFGPYMRELQRRIKMNWDPPKGNESKRVVLMFKIGRDGRLLSNRVLKSSGLPSADSAAKHAVELTAPFKPLPPEYKGDSVDIQFTFDYNVFGASMY